MPNRRILLFGLIALLILISLAFLGTGFFYYQYRSVQSQLNRFLKNPQEALREESLFNRYGRIERRDAEIFTRSRQGCRESGLFASQTDYARWGDFLLER